MPPRTIRQARQRLEELADGLNPITFKRLNDEIKAAEAEATRTATGHASARRPRCYRRQQRLRRLCETRDGFKALAAEGKAGRVSSKDATKRFNDLKAEERRLHALLGDVEAGLATVQSIEADPVAYADENFHDRYPATGRTSSTRRTHATDH